MTKNSQKPLTSEASFGANLKALRKKAGLTQPELAYLIGVHETTIRAWELNDRLPKSGYIKRLAEALHVSEQQLLSPDREHSRWVLTIKVAQDLEGEVINLSKGIPSISSIAYTPEGGVLTLGGSFDMWADDENFKQFIKDLKNARTLVLNGMKSLNGKKN